MTSPLPAEALASKRSPAWLDLRRGALTALILAFASLLVGKWWSVVLSIPLIIIGLTWLAMSGLMRRELDAARRASMKERTDAD